MSAIAWVAMICFYGDGSDLTDRCFDARFQIDTVFECRTSGDAAPLDNTNGAISFPGDGVMWAYETDHEGRRDLVVASAYASRGYSSFNPTNAAVYVPRSASFSDDFEDTTCSCFTRLPGGCL